MAILNAIKDKFGSVKNYALRILTPLEYMEYVGKMLLVLEKDKVNLFISITLLMNVVLIAFSFTVNFGIKRTSLLVSILILISSGIAFKIFRERMSKDTKGTKEVGNIKIMPITLPKIELPEELKVYTEENNKNLIESDEEPLVTTPKGTVNKIEIEDLLDLEMELDYEETEEEYTMNHKQFDDIWEE